MSRADVGRADPRLARASVSIDAPASVVWSVMLDFSEYHLWNPFIRRADAPADRAARVGDPITLYVRFRGGKTYASPERITTIEPPAGDPVVRALLEYEFYGRLHTTGLIRGRRSQRIEQEPGGPTTYRTEERFRGGLAFVLSTRAVQDGFERHAEALKARAELLAR